MPTLELKNVSYTYEKSKAVLQNVSAELETGKMYAILGPSGSGKTTLLSLLGGLDVPTQGSVLFDGEDITTKGLEHHRRNHISLIFQSYNLIDYMTPVENVRLTAKLDAALCWYIQPAQQGQQRSLARPGRAEDGIHLPGF